MKPNIHTTAYKSTSVPSKNLMLMVPFSPSAIFSNTWHILRPSNTVWSLSTSFFSCSEWYFSSFCSSLKLAHFFKSWFLFSLKISKALIKACWRVSSSMWRLTQPWIPFIL